MTSLPAPSSVERLINRWIAEPTIGDNIVRLYTTPMRNASHVPIPDDVPGPLQHLLIRQGIISLYSHQAEAWEAAVRGENVVIVTGTASGKTLCYNLPVFSTMLGNESARALYIFPTKALAQDQSNLISRWLAEIPLAQRFGASIYDGDTSSSME